MIVSSENQNSSQGLLSYCCYRTSIGGELQLQLKSGLILTTVIDNDDDNDDDDDNGGGVIIILYCLPAGRRKAESAGI